MSTTERVREILSWYGSDSPGTLNNLARLLGHGRLGGSGHMVILPVDQGFEHGPARSFAGNPPAYDPRYHFQLAVEAGCNAYAAPLGLIEAGAREFAGQVPLILKLNNKDSLLEEKDPTQAQTASVKDALRLGCAAVGFTIYPGSTERFAMYERIRALAEEAKASGLAVVIWSYPRGSGLDKAGETAIDVCGYAAQIAQEAARKVYEKEKVPIESLADRVRHVVQCAFNGRRIVIFSGGPSETDDKILAEVRGIRDGGGFGSIIGRNSFQRKKADALKLLDTIMKIYAGQIA